ncbi:conserved oligomeric Golgi complex subunit 1 [Sorex araneus]|uniref:conserved oligomeric Golgi complex subunit 1 n=1 Tax=Sorex araneus TaxID=42254 RepID=UPI0024338AE6|nr:conserved oligomeric Golgi complex subunit 1 [Sorex araneus]
MAAAAASPALKRLDLRDPAALFETHGAEEIRGLERQVRAEIEHKKEELRQMVGERYRDLIEAADTIGQMRRCAEGLLDAVRATDQYCSRLRLAGSTAPGPPQPQPPPQDAFYRVAAQIKLLFEIPEKIWSCLEAGEHLRATQLYLLCCRLHQLLQLQASGAPCSPVLSRFPILIRQVASASHFRSTILHESKTLLKNQAASDQAVAAALCSVLLLEESSPRQALTGFLMARKAALQKLLNQQQHGVGVKTQICSLVELLAATLSQAHALFYTPPPGDPRPDPSPPCGLLFSTLDSVTGQPPAGKGIAVLREELRLCSWFRYLPASIVEFQPALRTLAHPISPEYLRDTLQQWIHMCNEDIRSGVRGLLLYVRNMRGLAGIRDALWALLAAEAPGWGLVCRRLLDRPLLFWEDLMRPLFLERAQSLTQEAFDAIAGSCDELLSAALREREQGAAKPPALEHDLGLFLWSEGPGDLPPDAAWVSAAQRAQQARGGLAMKARAVSPCVQDFCAALDARLRLQLDDLQAYLPPAAPPAAPAAPGPFDRHADAGALRELLRTRCVGCVRRLAGRVGAELDRAQEAAGGARGASPAGALQAALFLARLCQALGELCPHLKQSILGQPGSAEKPARDPRPPKKPSKGPAAEPEPAQAQWQEVRALLQEQSLRGFRAWSNAVVDVLAQDFTQSLLLDDAGSVLAAATSWEELEIQEEAESGHSVTSKIRLPVQPSWYVQSFLFGLCQEVSRVGGHALPKVTLQEMLKSCLARVVAAYEKLAADRPTKQEGAFPVTQNRALQLLYDLRYLSMVLTAKGDEAKGGRSKQDSRTEKVVDYLEGLIDPFDLDVFTPHLNSHLQRLVQRTSVLFGLVTGPDSQFAPRSGTFHSQEPHNILPLASSQIRFGLLPLSMTSTRKAKSTARSTESKAQVAAPALSQAGDPSQPGSLFRQLVSEEEDSSASSLFKLGWLSSMTK